MHNASELVRLWEDDTGNLLGWVIIYPRFSALDYMVHPAHYGDLESAMIAWGVGEVHRWNRKKDAENVVYIDVFEGDAPRIAALTQHGFTRKGLTRQMMIEGLHRMKAAGLETAIVWHEVDNPASTALYDSLGFQPKYRVFEYVLR